MGLPSKEVSPHIKRNTNNNDPFYGHAIKKTNSPQTLQPNEIKEPQELSFVDRVRRLKNKEKQQPRPLANNRPNNESFNNSNQYPDRRENFPSHIANRLQKNESPRTFPVNEAQDKQPVKQLSTKETKPQMKQLPKQFSQPIPPKKQNALKEKACNSNYSNPNKRKRSENNETDNHRTVKDTEETNVQETNNPELLGNGSDPKSQKVTEPLINDEVGDNNSTPSLSTSENVGKEGTLSNQSVKSSAKESSKIEDSSITDDSTKTNEINGDDSNNECTLPLHQAVKYGDVKKVKELLVNGVDVNSKDVNGCMPIHEAMREGEHALDIVRVLVEHKADVNGKSNRGSTALHGAVAFLSQDIVDYLLVNGADPTIKNSFGKTPLDIASMSEFQKNKHIYQILSCFLPDNNIGQNNDSKTKQNAD